MSDLAHCRWIRDVDDAQSRFAVRNQGKRALEIVGLACRVSRLIRGCQDRCTGFSNGIGLTRQ